MKNSTLIHNLNPEDITEMFHGIQSQLDELKNKFEPKTPSEYLTRIEVAELLKCDLSTVHNWTKKGKLIGYGIGNRIYYKRAEIEAMIKPINS